MGTVLQEHLLDVRMPREDSHMDGKLIPILRVDQSRILCRSDFTLGISPKPQALKSAQAS
jgi:hypothetical protein